MAEALTLGADVATLELLAGGATSQAKDENFPVALRVLPARPRALLRRVYAYARFVDDVGDRAPGDRLRLLEQIELDVRAAASGTARISVVRALGPSLATGELPIAPLLDLVAANRMDQTVTSYATLADLLGYCGLSAAPIGRLVLAVAGVRDAESTALADRVCAALQVLEHCQDVGEDARAGRVYLPADDLAAAGVPIAELKGRTTTPALRAVVALQVDRAVAMLADGRELVGRLTGWARLAVAGYVAGGLATADALRAADHDVLARAVVPSSRQTARRAAMLLRARSDVEAAYRRCEEITRREARNFAWGIRLLPPAKRRALSAVYAFARRVDDIGDGDLPAAQKLERLAAARTAAADPAAHPDDPVLCALVHAAQRFPLPLEAFGDLVRGCEMDVAGHRYETVDDLVEYGRCVAGSIGRLSLGVFDPPLRGTAATRAAEYADALGVALQITNVLRDVREDFQLGRVYLPAEDLEKFGCTITLLPDGSLDPQGGRLLDVIRFEAGRAAEWYAQGLRLLPLLDRRSAACCAAMSGIYRELLARIASDPAIVLHRRASLPASAKARIASRSLAGRHG